MTQVFTYLLMHGVPCPLLLNDSAKHDMLGCVTRVWDLRPQNSNSGEIFVQCN